MKKILLFVFIIYANYCVAQQPIFATIAGGDLYSFDLINCTRTFKGSSGYGFGDIAFTNNGKLWGILSGELYSIDTNTAASTLVGNYNIITNALVGLNDTILLTVYQSCLYKINVNSFDTTFVDSVGYDTDGDLTWFNNDLFIVTGGGGAVKITLNANATAISNVILLPNNIPSCEGAATAKLTNDFNTLIGFNGNDVLKICRLDGTNAILCDDLNIGGTPGAAYIRYFSPVISEPTCEQPNTIIIEKEIDISVYYNYSNSSIVLHNTNNQNTQYKLIDLAGKLIQEGCIKDNSNTIKVTNPANGLYILQLKQANTLGCKKVFIN
jgi:hypothetical protein